MTQLKIEETLNNIRQLEEQQEKNEAQQRGMHYALEIHNEQFQRSNRIYTELDETFYRNDFAHIFQQMQDDIHDERRQLFDCLEDELDYLKKEQVNLEEELSEKHYNHRQLLNQVEEEQEHGH